MKGLSAVLSLWPRVDTASQAVRSVTDLLSPAWRVNIAEPINLLSQRPGKADIPADMLMSGRNNYPLNGIAHVYAPEGLSLRTFLKGLHCQPCLLVWILTQKCSFPFFLPTLCAENNCRAHSPYALLSALGWPCLLSCTLKKHGIFSPLLPPCHRQLSRLTAMLSWKGPPAFFWAHLQILL